MPSDDIRGATNRHLPIVASCAWLAFVAFVTPALAAAQPPPDITTTLSPPIAVLNHEFGRIVNVRELSDGRVLVGDGPEKRLVVADFGRQTVRQVGVNGNGPGEYPNAAMLHPLGGDTTLATDAQTRRWLLLVGDRVEASVPADHPAMIATRGAVAAATRSGKLVTASYPLPGPGTSVIGPGDSMAVVRVEFATGRADTLGRARRPRQTYTGLDVEGNRTWFFTSKQAFEAGEAFDAAPNGWVAVARLDPYRVDWWSPDGRMIRGAPIPYEPVKVTEKEKDFHRSRYPNLVTGPRVFPPGVTAAQQAAIRTATTRQFNDFPPVLPPFTAPAIVTMSDDAAFILRTPTAALPGYVFDVIDHHGRLVARLQMARGERIIGTGKGCIYVAAEDDDGLDHLRKHAWP